MQFSALSGATNRSQSRPRSDGNEEVLRIPQSTSITGASPSDPLVSYPGHSLLGSYPSAEIQLVYFTASDDWAISPLCFILRSSVEEASTSRVYSWNQRKRILDMKWRRLGFPMNQQLTCLTQYHLRLLRL